MSNLTHRVFENMRDLCDFANDIRLSKDRIVQIVFNNYEYVLVFYDD